MHIVKKACGLLAVIALGLNVAACSHADKGGGTTVNPTVVVPVAQDANGNPVPFAVSPTNVGLNTPATLTWAVQGASSCIASGDTSNGKWTGPQPTTSPSGGVQVGPYSMPGTYSYTLTCTSPTGGKLAQSATLTVGNATSANGVSLVSNTSTAKPGETIALSWTTTGDLNSCTASSTPTVSDWSGMMPTTSTVSGTWLTLKDVGSYVFTLTCSGPGGTATSSYPVTVNSTAASAPPLLKIAATPSTVAPGSPSTIGWTTANATSCAATSNETVDSWNGSNQPVNDLSNATPTTFGTASSLPDGTYNYALACTGPGGNVSQTAQLLVGKGSGDGVPSLTFTVSDSTTPSTSQSTTVKVGSLAYLSWMSNNASICVATGGRWAPNSEPTSHNNLLQGPFNSPGNYSFALSCTNQSGNSVSQVVDVIVTSNGPTVTFTAQPNPAIQGVAPTLTWTTSDDATSCVATAGPSSDSTWTGTQPTSGSHNVPSSVYNSPGTYDYVLSCTGPTGTTSKTLSLVVNPNSAGSPQFTTDFTASPANLPASGGTTTLNWATSGSTTCTASSSPAVTGWSGDQPTSSPSAGVMLNLPANSSTSPVSYTLQLVCSNASGTSTQMQVVTVQGSIPMPTVTLSANPLTLEAGPDARTTLSYTTSNVTSCATTDGTATGVWADAPVPNSGPTPVPGTAQSTPMTDANSYTYMLICSGPGGTAAAVPVVVTVTSPAPAFKPVKGQPTAGLFVTTTPGSTAPATQVAPGGNLYFSWDASNATACVPSSNEPGTSAWANTTTDVSGDDVAAKASNVPGIYNYKITCSGPTNPPAVSTVTVTVISPTASLCPSTPTAAGAPVPSMALLTDSTEPAYAATTPSATGSSICVGCSVSGLANVTDVPTTTPTPPVQFPFNFDNFATMILPVGVLTPNADVLNVGNTSATQFVYPVGRTVNVGLTVPNTLLAASVLGNVSIATTLNGVEQDATPSGALTLQLLGLINNGSANGYATLTATKPFDGVRINYGGTVSALSELHVHMACVSLQ